MRIRSLVCLALAACSATPTPPSAPQVPTAPPRGAPRAPVEVADPIDPIAALEPASTTAWLVPGRIQLDLASTPLDAPGGDRPLEVALFARQGNLVRAAIRLPHVRFAAWTERAQLLAVVSAAHRLDAGTGDVHVTLHPGAVVRRLARRDGRTHVRYVGALEVEGWIPDAKLADSGPARVRRGRRPSRRRSLMLTPGAAIRAEPRWSAPQLAALANGYFVELVQAVDPAWSEISYVDDDLSVHGYVSKQAPPTRIHRPSDASAALDAVTPNAKVASGTCLYATRGGEAIGYVVGDREVALDDAGGGWWTLALDTPWGPIAFAAHGLARETLATCAPTGSVPPSTLAP